MQVRHDSRGESREGWGGVNGGVRAAAKSGHWPSSGESWGDRDEKEEVRTFYEGGKSSGKEKRDRGREKTGGESLRAVT